MGKKAIFLLALLVLSVAVWLFVRRASSSDLYKSIPASSGVVCTIDLISLSEKANLPELVRTGALDVFFGKELAAPEKGEVLKELLKEITVNPLSAGINFLDPLAAFAEEKDRKLSGGMVLGIADEESFSSFLKKAVPGAQIRKADKYSYIHGAGDAYAIGWNGSRAVIYLHHTVEGVLERLDSLIGQKIVSIGKNSFFRSFSQETADIAFFINPGKMPRSSSGFSDLNSFMLPDYMAGRVNFEQGKIVLEGRNYFEKKADRKRAEWLSSGTAADVLPLLARQKPAAFFNARFDFHEFFDFLMEDPDMASAVEEASVALGVESSALKNLLSGEVALSLGGAGNSGGEEEGEVFEDLSAGAGLISQLSLFVGVGDREVYEKVMRSTGLQKNALGYYDIPVPFMSIKMAETEQGIVITMNPSLAGKLTEEGILSEGGFGELSAFSTAYSSVFYADLDTAHLDGSMKRTIRLLLGADGYALFTEAMEPFSTVKMWSVSAEESRGEIGFKDLSSNSLYQLLRMVEGIVLEKNRMEEDKREKDRQIYEEEMTEESILNG
jgi:hypothetical protein